MSDPYVKLQQNLLIVTASISWAKTTVNNTLQIRHIDGSETVLKYGRGSEALADLEKIEDAFGGTGEDNVNPVKFDTTYSDPTTAGFTPVDTTKGCFWFGVGGTFYSWNPGTATWEGIITL